jgi:ethanolamine ammonia-lyase small subunit
MTEEGARASRPDDAGGMPALLADLRRATPARIALGRAGVALPTAAHLDFQRAHALARDAVYAAIDVDGIAAGLIGLGTEPIRLGSLATDRPTYLRRPDLGRRLDVVSRAALENRHSDIAFVIADGLSATAVNRHAVPLIRALKPRPGPVAIVTGGRVAIGDEIGGLLGADLVAVLIGERPGLSAADSLGVYVTWQPAPGAVDSARNCLSNIRPEGMPVEDAATALRALFDAARRYRMTGVGLSQRLAIERK